MRHAPAVAALPGIGCEEELDLVLPAGPSGRPLPTRTSKRASSSARCRSSASTRCSSPPARRRARSAVRRLARLSFGLRSGGRQRRQPVLALGRRRSSAASDSRRATSRPRFPVLLLERASSARRRSTDSSRADRAPACGCSDRAAHPRPRAPPATCSIQCAHRFEAGVETFGLAQRRERPRARPPPTTRPSTRRSRRPDEVPEALGVRAAVPRASSASPGTSAAFSAVELEAQRLRGRARRCAASSLERRPRARERVPARRIAPASGSRPPAASSRSRWLSTRRSA
jgi:hypothetical protein